MNPAIYIDDTGTPEKSKSKYDPGNWKTWVAIVMPGNERSQLSGILTALQKDLKFNYGADEFHFTDIFAAKNKFKKVSVDERIEIFAHFVAIYQTFKFPILVQSLTEDDWIRNQMVPMRHLKINGFDFSKLDHAALWFLLKNLSHHKAFKSYNLPFDIHVDSGKQKPNTKQKIDLLKNFSTGSCITYKNSADDPLMQFIDFVAFTLNRCRWILMNNKNSQSDLLLLKLAEAADFKTLNMKKLIINPSKEDTVSLYDKTLREAYDKNGNLSDEEVEMAKKGSTPR